METCQSCKYFMPQSDEQGLCRRSPPTVLVYPDGQTVSVFPPMLAEEGWCGEFDKKELQQ